MLTIAAQVSLRQAIADALSGDTIIFDTGLSGQTIRLATTLTLSKNVTIDGSALASPITISGDTDNDGTGNVRVFHVSYVTASMIALNITKGISTGYYGGGGIWNEGGTLTVKNVTFSQNVAYGGGGGINNNGIYNASILAVINSTFSNNSGGDGGGISNYGGILNVTNSTFSGNYASHGGGIYGSSLTITNSTFSGNIATLSGNSNGGGVYNTTGSIHFANNIIANSTGGDCVYSGTFITNINNLVEDGSCSASLSGDPKLAALASNGGPTQTMALQTGSSAIDAGDDATCSASPVNSLDQRGIARPQGIHCDIGAYEYQASTAPSVSINGGFNKYPKPTSKIPTSWVAASFAATDGKSTTIKQEGAASIKIIGANGKTKTLTQTRKLSGAKGNAFKFSYWVKASNKPTLGLCQAQVSFYSGTLLKGTKTLKCPAGKTYDWKQVTMNFTAPAAYTSVKVIFTYSKAGGTIWFDAVGLIK